MAIAAISGAYAEGTVSSGISTTCSRVDGAFPYCVTKNVNSLIAVSAYLDARASCVGLKKTCRSTPASSLLYSLKVPAMIVPGKLGLSHEKVNVLVFAVLVVGPASGGSGFSAFLEATPPFEGALAFDVVLIVLPVLKVVSVPTPGALPLPIAIM